MISINKVNNAIQITFEGNDKYLHNGVIDVAVNDLILVVDESDLATFKRSSTGDVLFSQLIDNIQIAGESVTKGNIIEKFAAIGYGSTGGGGGVDVDAVGEIVDQKIAELVDTAPEALDTLNELATALGDDPNFATTMATELGKKANAADVYTKKEIDDQLGDIDEALDAILNGETTLDYLTREQADALYAPKGGINVVTQAEYDALGDVVNSDNKLYFITQ